MLKTFIEKPINFVSVAEENGFGDGLEKAAAVMAEYVKQPNVIWETDISDKIKDVCADYGVPEEIVM